MVTFIGRVRNHSQGREVLRLEYEGAEALARHQFDELAREARAAYDVHEIGCTHRVGALEIGDIAVCVGFYDHSALNRGFRKHLGCTPREYRSKHAKGEH